MDADIFAGCPKQGIGFVWNTLPKLHYNVGMMYVTNSQQVKDFLNEWVGWYPGPINGWHEQAMLNLFSQVPALSENIVQIDNKYNSCVAGGTHVDDAVVEAWHGAGSVSNRLQLMRDYLANTAKR
jgi:hypothetical protein